jgi:hypothetical protein
MHYFAAVLSLFLTIAFITFPYLLNFVHFLIIIFSFPRFCFLIKRRCSYYSSLVNFSAMTVPSSAATVAEAANHQLADLWRKLTEKSSKKQL